MSADDTTRKAAEDNAYEVLKLTIQDVFTDCPEGVSAMTLASNCHRTLADAGLLAPAPLREMSKYVRTADEFRKGEQGTRTHRCWVTDWFPVDAVNRAEGDGRAEG